MSNLSIPHRVRAWAAQRGITLTLNNIRPCAAEWVIEANTDQLFRLVEALREEAAPMGRKARWPNEQEERKARIANGQIHKEKLWVEVYPHRLETP